jgi:ABC-type multidrug transport system fused ATPase/permease subunit
MDFVSVERVVELLHVEQEPSGTVSPPAWWPSYNGDIIFEDVTIRYAPHLDPALNAVSFKIRTGSNTAIIGRTGTPPLLVIDVAVSLTCLQARARALWH